MISTLLGIALSLVAVFLILIVLVQRGRGGGLAGALGGAGGQSAFGTKAGDTFTRVTIVTAAIWILLCMVSIKVMGSGETKFTRTGGGGMNTIKLPDSRDDQDKPATNSSNAVPANEEASNEAPVNEPSDTPEP